MVNLFVRHMRRFEMPKSLELLFYAFMTIGTFSAAASSQQEISRDFSIPNTEQPALMTPLTNVNAGPCVGQILNAHFFPGLVDYQKGNYRYAAQQMDYFIARPQYTESNPRQAEYFSIALYVRGSILLHHASGIGRLNAALQDLRAAVRWNARNYPALLDLAEVNVALGDMVAARNALKALLAGSPDPATAAAAREKLESLKSTPEPRR